MGPNVGTTRGVVLKKGPTVRPVFRAFRRHRRSRHTAQRLLGENPWALRLRHSGDEGTPRRSLNRRTHEYCLSGQAPGHLFLSIPCRPRARDRPIRLLDDSQPLTHVAPSITLLVNITCSIQGSPFLCIENVAFFMSEPGDMASWDRGIIASSHRAPTGLALSR